MVTNKNKELDPAEAVHVRTRQGGVVTITTTAQLHSTKPEFRFCARFRISSECPS